MLRSMVLASASLLACSVAEGQTCSSVPSGVVCQMIAPQNDFTIRPLQGSAFYGDSDSNKSNIGYWIGQWGIPAQNPAFKQQSSGIWESGSNNADIQLTKTAGGYYSLAQSGGSLPCYNYSTGVGEFDLYVDAMGPEGGPAGYKLGIASNWSGGRSQTLSNMTNAVLSLGLSGQWLQPSSHQGGYCSDQGSIDQYNVLVGLTLNDSTTGQAMFYQGSFGTGAVQKDSIVNTTSSPQYFEVNSGSVWGFDDPATSTIGQHIPFDGNFYNYSFDMLPRLKYAISHDPSGKLDQNLSHWVISGLYTGQAIWGNLLLTTAWQNVAVSVGFAQ